jgi:hypothetical protein
MDGFKEKWSLGIEGWWQSATDIDCHYERKINDKKGRDARKEVMTRKDGGLESGL